MRYHTRLLVLPMAIAVAMPATFQAQTNDFTMSNRWNRLVAQFYADASASRRAARATAAAAHDSVALRKIAMTQPPLTFLVYTPLSVAQYAAVNSARENRNVSADAAVASASAAVLTAMFADSTARASIARELDLDIARATAKSGTSEPALAGRKLGEDVARRVLAVAPKMNFVAPWNGTVPTGPGMWYSAPGLPPLGIAIINSHGWTLDSASQFRPAPPPKFGSPEWNAAIDEVKRVARGRTGEQTAIAQKWDSGDPFVVWNDKASDEIRQHGLSDADGARVLAVLNASAVDAEIACFEAKYHYWTIRPSQADTTIALAAKVGLPNFPSFPSGHACSAGAFEAVLSHFFPGEKAEFHKIAEEQAMSRLYGGIHYRFDNDGGLALGRIVARHVIDREKRGGLNAWRTASVAGKQ
ncbi:MAG TPA: vanadium-dependent haloperoxidase [Gemmatimonadaceae bacterium]|nr:vanadium-dependent haloperoxidase [Gemmatimonadaceae bacterium]